MFFIPLVQPLQRLSYAYGPALIVVGITMLGSAARIDYDDLTESVPAFATLAMMVFAYNIATGITAGLMRIARRLNRAWSRLSGLLCLWIAALIRSD